MDLFILILFQNTTIQLNEIQLNEINTNSKNYIYYKHRTKAQRYSEINNQP